MAKKTLKITITDELKEIIPFTKQGHYIEFKEKATSSELTVFLRKLEKLDGEHWLSQKVLAAFEKDIKQTKKIKDQMEKDDEKELEEDRKKDEKDYIKIDNANEQPISRLRDFLTAVKRNPAKFDPKEFVHLLNKCMQRLFSSKSYFSDHFHRDWRKSKKPYGKDDTIFGMLQEEPFTYLSQQYPVLKMDGSKGLNKFFFISYKNRVSYQQNQDIEVSYDAFKEERKETVKDVANDDRKNHYKYTSSIEKEKRSADDKNYVKEFSSEEKINDFVDAIKEETANNKKPKKTAKNNITAEQEVEDKATTSYKQTEEIRDIQDVASESRKPEAEIFSIDIGFDDVEQDEEMTAIQEQSKDHEKKQKRIQELDEEIAYGGYEHWKEGTFNEYFEITNAFKQIELIRNSKLKDDHQFLIKHFKPEYLALWPEQFSNPDFLNEVAQRANIDDVQKLLFMFTEDPTIFNKYDQTAPKSADKFLGLLNTYMQRLVDGKGQDAGSFKNLQFLYDKLFPDGKAICPQLEQYEGFLNSILNKDINYENLKKWKKSLPKKFQKKLETNAKKSRAETLTNKQISNQVDQIVNLKEGEKLYWDKETIKQFIENDKDRRMRGVSIFALDVERMLKALPSDTIKSLDDDFKVSVFDPELLRYDKAREIFDEHVIKKFVRKGSMHDAKRMLFMYAHDKTMMQPDVYLACLAEFTDRLMTTKNQTERANFYSLRGLYDTLFPENETERNPLLPYKNMIKNMFEVNEKSYAKGFGAWKRSLPEDCVATLRNKADVARAKRVDEELKHIHNTAYGSQRSKEAMRQMLAEKNVYMTDEQFEKAKLTDLEEKYTEVTQKPDENEDEGDELD